jgi:tetratricopeptide (TPR) repeat protein
LQNALWSARLAAILLALPALSAQAFAQQQGPRSLPVSATSKIGIFGKDTRRKPPDKYSELMNSVGQLEMRLGRSRTLCTTFCVADSVVATAAHCLFGPQARNRLTASSIAIGQGANRRVSAIAGGTEERMEWSVVSGTTSTTSAAPYNSAHDWALVRLAVPICKGRTVKLSGKRDGSGVWPRMPESEMFILAYHADTGASSLKVSDDCMSSDVPLEPDLARWIHAASSVSSDDLLLHRCDISRGASGSPVFLGTAIGPAVVGLNVVAEGIRTGRGQRQEWDKRVSANRSILTSAFESQIALLRDTPEPVSKDELKSVQSMLKEAGYYKGEITGVYGRETRQAVLDLERAHDQPATGRPSAKLVTAARSTGDRRSMLRELLAHRQQRPRDSAADEEAVSAFIIAAATKAIELDPKLALAYGSRCAVYLVKGEYDRAIADCTKLIEIDARFSQAYNYRGSAYRARKAYDRAIADFTKAIEIDPKNVNAHVGRGVVYLEMGDFDRAIAECDRALTLDPKDATAYNNRAWTYLKAGRAAQGLPDVKRSLELNPDNAPALDTLAHILEATGRKEEAIAAFRNALEVNPTLKESAEGLKRLGAEP